MGRSPGDLESSARDRELMFALDKRCRDADILASLQTPFTVNQIVYSIDDQLHQLHLKNTNPWSLLPIIWVSFFSTYWLSCSGNSFPIASLLNLNFISDSITSWGSLSLSQPPQTYTSFHPNPLGSHLWLAQSIQIRDVKDIACGSSIYSSSPTLLES